MIERLKVLRSSVHPGRRQGGSGVQQVERRVPVGEIPRAPEVEAVKVEAMRNDGGIRTTDVVVKSDKSAGGH